MPVKNLRNFIMSGILIITAVINYLDERALKVVIIDLFAAVIFLIIAILQNSFFQNADKEKRMFNNIIKGCIVALAIVLFVMGTVWMAAKPDGNTVESREELLENLPRGLGWNISTETELSGHIISGIYSVDGKSGIAVFAPMGTGKYKLLARQWRDNNEVIIFNFVVDNIWYDMVWFNGAETEYAEITYTYDGKKQEPIIHNSRNMEIFINPAPAEDYSVNVVYYDRNGNKYE